MGFISKLIGGLFSFLGSIFKVFNIFKKSEYYLEAPDLSSEPSAAPAAKAETPKAKAPAPEAKPAKAAKAAKGAKEASNGKVEKPAATVAAAKPVKVVPAAAPAPAAAKAEPVTLFAPNFLGTASSGGRRRPGPSLSPYMDMAKKVKA